MADVERARSSSEFETSSSENLGVDASEMTLETHFRDDLEADSLDLAEMIMDFEDKFGVGDISEEDAQKIETVGDAVTYITNKSRQPVVSSSLGPVVAPGRRLRAAFGACCPCWPMQGADQRAWDGSRPLLK